MPILTFVDHTIASILLYGYEIWRSFNPLASKFKDKDVTMNKIFYRLKCETLHINFCKSILGLQQKSSNFAILSELWRFPLYYQINKAMINYWFWLETLHNPSLILFSIKEPLSSKETIMVFIYPTIIYFTLVYYSYYSQQTELNPGPRTPKYPCMVCGKAVKWNQRAVAWQLWGLVSCGIHEY
jgi:hypothetical protein